MHWINYDSDVSFLLCFVSHHPGTLHSVDCGKRAVWSKVSMLFDKGVKTLSFQNSEMQKTTYYDNSGIFSGYSYQKSNTYNYSSGHQTYPPPSVDGDYQNSTCPVQTSSARAPTHKSTDINGSCMRTSSNQGTAQLPSISEPQQPPPLPPSPNGSNTATQKRTKSIPNSSSGPPATLTKQIFPWMKESRQNTKQKNNCTVAGIFQLFVLFSALICMKLLKNGEVYQRMSHLGGSSLPKMSHGGESIFLPCCKQLLKRVKESSRFYQRWAYFLYLIIYFFQ